MTDILAIIAGLVLLVGAAFVLLAAVGVLRLPDIYARMHAGSKAGTLGSGLALIALALHANDFAIIMRALAGVVFFLLTAPLGAHLLARAAYLSGHKPVAGTAPDALGAALAEKAAADEAGGEQ